MKAEPGERDAVSGFFMQKLRLAAAFLRRRKTYAAADIGLVASGESHAHRKHRGNLQEHINTLLEASPRLQVLLEKCGFKADAGCGTKVYFRRHTS